VHDPVLIRQDSTYYLFATGRGIAVWSSPDRVHWKREAPVFASAPTWAGTVVPDFKNHVWAPDISYHDGTYYLFYSVSTFGKNTSAIGLATNRTLHPTDPAYRWEDQGIIVQSVPGRDDFNAIDPNLVTDEAGVPYLAFGSFWTGLKLVRLRNDRRGIASPAEWYALAARPRADERTGHQAGTGAIEAPFIVRRGSYYYLFASYDYCCRGAQSTYHVRVGRATQVTGPYLDREGRKLTEGGGTPVVAGNADWYGVGHNAVVSFEGIDYLVYHGYDAHDGGKSKLLIRSFVWDSEGWPALKP
jgi:arabinan endo-1,5-alpha-L-arabinosidase